MNVPEKTHVDVNAFIEAPMLKVWECWTTPMHIVRWNHASPDWHTPHASNELKVGGKFLYRMEAKDGSEGFDFKGVYKEVVPYEKINYVMDDGREVTITFQDLPEGSLVKENFEVESSFPVEIQREGWKAILDNFKKYTESLFQLRP